jgi:hypothetical protein
MADSPLHILEEWLSLQIINLVTTTDIDGWCLILIWSLQVSGFRLRSYAWSLRSSAIFICPTLDNLASSSTCKHLAMMRSGQCVQSRIWDGRCRESVISRYMDSYGPSSHGRQLMIRASDTNPLTSVSRLPWLPALLFPLLSLAAAKAIMLRVSGTNLSSSVARLPWLPAHRRTLREVFYVY